MTFTSFSFVNGQARPGEQGQPQIVGWADDTHYLLQTKDESGLSKVKIVDVKSGKTIIVSDYRSETDALRKSLPEGFTLTATDELSDDFKAAVISRNKDLWYFKAGGASAVQLTFDGDEEKNPRISPNGTKVCYTKNKDLYVYDLTAGKELRLTTDATDKVYNGWSSWIYYEEIFGRSSRYAAFWWSPDSRKIAYLHTDETMVPEYTLNALENTDGPRGRLEVTPYPKAGDPNPVVKMGMADIATGKTVWIKTNDAVDQYIAWPSWTPDSRRLMVQVMNRDQNDIRFLLADASTGDYSEIYRESRNTWVNLFDDVYVLNDGSGFILRSDKTDWSNLYYYGWDGTLKSQITNLPWKVTEISRVDEAGKIVYFIGTGPESTDSHFFRVGINGKNLVQLTKGAGTHKVNLSPAGSFMIDSYSSVTDQGGIIVIDKKAKVIDTIYRSNNTDFNKASASRSGLVKIKTSDGKFDLPAIITYPENFNPEKRYPVVFTVYGGPDAISVTNAWQGNRQKWFAENGIIVISVDHRGSGQFGKKGTDYLYRSLGQWEISDYSDVVKWLRTKSWVDSSRIGITGGSYGGYVACMALTKGADFWQYGIADFSVTDWRLYDNVYTERFMDMPKDNTEGYNNGSVLTYASSYKGMLLIRHGDMDDNVHMQNSLWLISVLQDLNKPFEFMLYPGERHGWRGIKRVYYTEEEHRFWIRSFFGE